MKSTPLLARVTPNINRHRARSSPKSEPGKTSNLKALNVNNSAQSGCTIYGILLFLLKVKTPAFQAGSILPVVEFIF